MLTNAEILRAAMVQSAIDSGCRSEDFTADKNIVVISQPNPSARKYLTLPFDCDLTTYGGNIVASVSADCEPVVRDYIHRFPCEHCFETPNLHVLNDGLQRLGLRVCFMAEYFLPDVTALKPLDCPYETALLSQCDFADLYLPEWSNALCERRKQLDVIGCGAYDNGRLIGLAGASADCDGMWQIGIDVLPDYRRRGIASALTSRLATEILVRGKIPFYCAAWSNIKSVRNAIRAGFRPAWAQMTAKSIDFVDKMNGN